MIHYHGSPISGSGIDAAQFYRGRHAMVSFANPQSLAVVADVTQSFVLDNGAFTVWKQGGQLDLEGFGAWVDAWREHPGFDWCLIPDVIDGDEGDNDALVHLWSHGWKRACGVPVWHLHESLDRLRRLASQWSRVALGSSGVYATPGTESWRRRMCEAMDTVCHDGRPICRLHGLRMLDPAIFTRYPFASADSCNAGINAGSLSRFGNYCPPTAAQRAEVIAERIEAYNSAACWVGSGQDSIPGLEARDA